MAKQGRGKEYNISPWKMKGGLFRENTKSVNKGYGSLNEYIKISTAQRVIYKYKFTKVWTKSQIYFRYAELYLFKKVMSLIQSLCFFYL